MATLGGMQLGNLAEWIYGLATAGSLFLALTILLRDRRKDDKAEATQVVVWFVNRPEGDVELTVRNGASRPIVNVMLCLAAVDEDGKRTALWKLHNIAPVLEPDEVKWIRTSFREFHANALYPSYVQFRDSNGISWRRNVRSGELRKTKVGLGWRGRLRLAKSPRRAISYMRARYHQW